MQVVVRLYSTLSGEIKKEVGMTIESIDNIDVAYALGKKYNIEMPLLNLMIPFL